jgi:hypothetical protein
MEQSGIYKGLPDLDAYVKQHINVADAHAECQIDRDQYVKKRSKFFDKF